MRMCGSLMPSPCVSVCVCVWWEGGVITKQFKYIFAVFFRFIYIIFILYIFKSAPGFDFTQRKTSIMKMSIKVQDVNIDPETLSCRLFYGLK